MQVTICDVGPRDGLQTGTISVATPRRVRHATGNIATEDLVYLFEGDGIDTGVDLDALIATSEWLEALLGRHLEGQVYRAGAWAGA
jgi:isopropylmalate/homocitrate/citramalate synthase